jgi:hypothetical protein
VKSLRVTAYGGRLRRRRAYGAKPIASRLRAIKGHFLRLGSKEEKADDAAALKTAAVKAAPLKAVPANVLIHDT